MSAGNVTTLVLVRHGEADNNAQARFGGWSDLPLTARGIRQAAAAGPAVAALHPDVVWSSDLPRAMQTAAWIATATGLAIHARHDLRERSVGELDGMAFVDAEARSPGMLARLRSREPGVLPPGAETVETVFHRVRGAIDAACVQHPGKTVVLVSHGIAIYHALCHVLGLGSPARAQSMFTLVDNASISVVEHHARAPHWRLRWVNRVDHLASVTPT